MKKPVCSLCNSKIEKKDMLLGKCKVSLPLYKTFHKRCYEKIIFRNKRLGRSWMKFEYDIGVYQLNALKHWMGLAFFSLIGIAIFYLSALLNPLLYFFIIFLVLGIIIELIELIYFHVKYY